MKFVRYKLKDLWYTDEEKQIKVIKNGLYLFPYFIDDAYTESFIITENAFFLNPDSLNWKKEFKFISKKEYLKETGVEESVLDVVIELLKTNERDNMKIALEIYKTLKINEHRYEE